MFQTPPYYPTDCYFDSQDRLRCRTSRNDFGIVHSLLNREVHGKRVDRCNNPFGSSIPIRLRMPVENVIPQRVLEAGNIFMGFTSCGTYLLSYTVRPAGEALHNFSWSESSCFIYTLHFWLFRPYGEVKKVCKVPLFDPDGVSDSSLLIEISQWRGDDKRLLITGSSVNPDSGYREANHSVFFATLATVPHPHSCNDCRYVFTEDIEDESMGENRTRLNCLKHGLTIHLSFDLVPPFPKFSSDVSLRFKDSVVFNSGNFIHILQFKYKEPSKTIPNIQEKRPQYQAKIPGGRNELKGSVWFKNQLNPNWLRPLAFTSTNNSTLLNQRTHSTLIAHSTRLNMKLPVPEAETEMEENVVAVNSLESFLAFLPNTTATALRFPPLVPHRRPSMDSSGDNFVSPSPSSDISEQSLGDNSVSNPSILKPASSALRHGDPKCPENPSANSKVKLMPPPRTTNGRKFFKDFRPGARNINATIKKLQGVQGGKKEEEKLGAFDVFEVFREDVLPLPERNFSSFRKRRLADKKYEFIETEHEFSTENILPLKLCRRSGKITSSRENPQDLLNSGGGESSTLSFEFNPSPRSPRGSLYNSAASIATFGGFSPNGGKSPGYSVDFEGILRPLSQNQKISGIIKVKTPISSPLAEEKEKKKKNCGQTNVNQIPTFTMTVNCIAKVVKTFMEKYDLRETSNSEERRGGTDEEDINCCPIDLPISVHGMAQEKLGVIANAKAPTTTRPIVQITQQTLDIEMLCNEVATLICISHEKQFSSCIDYDVAIVDVCPNNGSVTAVVAVVVQVLSSSTITKGSRRVPLGLCEIPREKFELVFSFVWNPSTESAKILYMGNLVEIQRFPMNWHPTEQLLKIIRAKRTAATENFYNMRILRNERAVMEWLSVDEISDAQGLITLYKEDTGSQYSERQYSTSQEVLRARALALIDRSSAASTTTSDDEDF